MRRSLISHFVAVVCFGTAMLPGQGSGNGRSWNWEAPSISMILQGGWVYDGEAFTQRDLYVAEGTIQSSAPSDPQLVLDLSGFYVVPPAGDAHTHRFSSAVDAATAREMFSERGRFYALNCCSKREAPGQCAPFTGPNGVDLRWSLGGFTCPGGHPVKLYEDVHKYANRQPAETFRPLYEDDGFYEVESEAQLKRKWALHLKSSPDFIKILLHHSDEYDRRLSDARYYGRRGLSRELALSIGDKAARAGLTLGAHVENAADYVTALDAGARYLLHAPGYALQKDAAPNAYLLSEELALRAAQLGVIQVATAGLASSAVARETLAKNLSRLKAAGVSIAFGTDDWFDVDRELKTLRELGVFSEAELLRMLVQTTPRAIFLDRRVGSLAVGAEASFLVLPEDPRQDVRRVEAFAFAVKQGALILPPEARSKRLDAESAREEVKLLRRTLSELHPGFGRYTSESATLALLDELARDVAEAGTTDFELYRRISAILAHLRCDHTKAELSPRMEAARRLVANYLPFRFRLFGGRMYIEATHESARVLQRGDEILSINGRSVGEILRAVSEYVPVDGWTDESKRVELEDSSEFLGDAVDHFWPMLYGWPESWSLECRSRETDELVRHELTPVTYPTWLEIGRAGATRYLNFPDAVQHRLLDEQTGYLRIDTFVNYRQPVDPQEVLDPAFDAFKRAGVQHLVLDLRGCGGGSDDVPRVLATYLHDTIVPAAKRPQWVRNFRVGDLRPYLSTWDPSAFEIPAELFEALDNGYYQLRQSVGSPRPAPARANRFQGRITILTSAANSSGATIFIALAKEHFPQVRTVGEATGGSAEGPTAGTIFFLNLPHSGIRVRIPVLRSWVNVANPAPGRGVVPDIEIVPSVSDWLAERDPVLDAARVWQD